MDPIYETVRLGPRTLVLRPSDCVDMILRHSFRDRLRSAGVQSELIDILGGWAAQSIGQSYGRNHDLEVLQKYMSSALCKNV